MPPNTRPAPPISKPTTAQIGAVCWRMNRGKVEVLLISSRDTGRWVIPKGWPMDQRTAAQAAEIEAWEEAGVRGAIADVPLGSFGYDKVLSPKKVQPCEVEVFALHVASLQDKFPERKQRRRKWFATEKAARKVNEPQLRNLLKQLPLLLTPQTLANT